MLAYSADCGIQSPAGQRARLRVPVPECCPDGATTNFLFTFVSSIDQGVLLAYRCSTSNANRPRRCSTSTSVAHLTTWAYAPRVACPYNAVYSELGSGCNPSSVLVAHSRVLLTLSIQHSKLASVLTLQCVHYSTRASVVHFVRSYRRQMAHRPPPSSFREQ